MGWKMPEEFTYGSRIGENNNISSFGSDIFGNDRGLMNNLFGGSYEGPNGGIMKNNGIVSPALSVFSAWNQYNQGQAAEEMANKQFDFSQDKFWNNYLMQKDAYNRKTNSANRQVAYTRGVGSGAGMSAADKYAVSNNLGTKYDGGDGITEIDGSHTTIGSAAPSKYARTNTPSAVVGMPAAGAAPAAVAKPRSAVIAAAPAKPKKKIV